MKKLFITLAAIFSSTAFANAPFEVSLSTNNINYFAYINITSDVDRLQINEVIANRGKCTATLSFGQGNKLDAFDKTAYVVKDCSRNNIREIIVKTNQGDYTFNVR